jgi:tetratricopeptide (TPR) repeat protein
MSPAHRCVSLSCLLFVAAAAFAQNTPAAPQAGGGIDKAAAYYDYSLGHMYAEMAAQNGNRGDYFDKAVESYRAALKADPTATFISEELSELYIQSGRIREAVTQAEDMLKQNPNDLSARRLLARIYTRLIGDSQSNGIDENMVRRAIEQYQKITDADPKDSDSWMMLGRLEKVIQNSTEAMAAYKKVLELEPDNEEAMTGLAMVYADLGDNKSAVELLRKVADKNPSLRSLTTLAGVYEQLKDYPLAAQMLRRALDQQPGNSDLKHALAEDLLMSNQLDDALKIYQELSAEDPKDEHSLLRISQIYRQKGDYPKAREAADKASQLDPDNLEIQFNNVNLLEAEGKSNDAIQVLKGILDATAKKSYSASERTNRVLLLDKLAFLYRSTDQVPLAVETLKEIAEVDPDSAPRAEAQIAATYADAKDYQKAEAAADAAYKKYPKDATVVAEHASLLADMGKIDQAASETRKLMDGKNDREIYLSLAQIYEKGKNFGEMAKMLDAAEKLSQTNDDKVNVIFLRGAMYERMKNLPSAEAEFRKVLALDPDNAGALNYLGYMLADRNIRLEEAKDLIVKALEKEPNTGAYLDSLGWVYFRLNRLPEAEEKLRAALVSMARDPTVHDHLAEVYFREGKLREAIMQWQNSLREWQTSPPGELDHSEMSRVQKRLEDARVRLAKETGAGKQVQ